MGRRIDSMIVVIMLFMMMMIVGLSSESVFVVKVLNLCLR